MKPPLSITAAGLTDKFRPPATKVCRLCKTEKPIKEFVLQMKNRDGRSHECRACKKGNEDRKELKRKEQAKTFFDAKYFD